MKILLTGASGFIGQNLVPFLLKDGNSIIVTTRDKNKIKMFDWYKKVEKIECDIFIDNHQFYENLNLDSLIHLAWDGLPNYNNELHDENYNNSISFINKIIKTNIKHLMIAGTCFEYGNQSGCLTEESSTKPTNAYGIAKNNLRKEMEYISNKNKIIFQWVRFFYLYGIGQNKNSLFGQLKSELNKKSKTFRMSKGDQTRDYLDIQEACKRLSFLVNNLNINGIINICSNIPITVEELIKNYLKENNFQINLEKGYYDYPEYEPKHFWGYSKYFDKEENLNEKN